VHGVSNVLFSHITWVEVHQMTSRSTLCAALITLLFCATVTAPSSGQYQPRVGQPHPNFVLPRIDERSPLSLAQFRGQKVLLIHFASW
jgi:hypothetical protein